MKNLIKFKFLNYAIPINIFLIVLLFIFTIAIFPILDLRYTPYVEIRHINIWTQTIFLRAAIFFIIIPLLILFLVQRKNISGGTSKANIEFISCSVKLLLFVCANLVLLLLLYYSIDSEYLFFFPPYALFIIVALAFSVLSWWYIVIFSLIYFVKPLRIGEYYKKPDKLILIQQFISVLLCVLLFMSFDNFINLIERNLKILSDLHIENQVKKAEELPSSFSIRMLNPNDSTRKLMDDTTENGGKIFPLLLQAPLNGIYGIVLDDLVENINFNSMQPILKCTSDKTTSRDFEPFMQGKVQYLTSLSTKPMVIFYVSLADLPKVKNWAVLENACRSIDFSKDMINAISPVCCDRFQFYLYTSHTRKLLFQSKIKL